MVIIFNKLLIVFKGVRKKIEHNYVYPYLCGTYSVIMRHDLLSSHLDVIGNLHHASAVHWRFFTKLSSSYLHTGVSFWYASKS